MTANAPTPAPPAQSLVELAHALKEEWRNGVTPDARAALDEYPSLLRHRTLVVDLAYEEYCLREARGLEFDAGQFCEGMPAFRSQVRDAILGHEFLARHPELFGLAEPEWPLAGDQVEGITILRELGRGAFARAYLGRDEQAGPRLVVLKLSPGPAPEAHTLGNLQHPQIAGILWAKQSPEMSVLCMPYRGATTLRDVIELASGAPGRCGRTILDGIQCDNLEPAALLFGPSDRYAKAVARLAAPLAAALAYLHSKGIVHGDLKPSNIILGPGGHPHLIDFNLSRGGQETLLRGGGTLPYMAPEQIDWLLGKSVGAAPSPATDVFGFGVVLFEALTGRLPHPIAPGLEPSEAADRLREAWRSETPGARSFDRAIPRRLFNLVTACLERDPARRPSAERLQGELTRLTRPSRGPRWAAALLAVVLIGIAVATTANRGMNLPKNEAPPPSLPKQPATAQEWTDYGIGKAREDDLVAALAAFAKSGQLKRDGRSMALMGYVHSRQGHPGLAAGFYTTSIDEHYDEAWVHNNLAHALSQLSPKPGPKLQEAIREATRARVLDGKSRSVRYNWCCIRYLNNLQPTTKRLNDEECVQEMLTVLDSGPADSDVFFQAGTILAAASETGEARRSRALECLRRSVALGKLPRQLTGDPVLKRNLLPDEFEAVILDPLPLGDGHMFNLRLANPLE